MATTTAYLVEAGEYEDRRVLVISLDQAAAQRYADHHNCQRNRSMFAEVSEIECISADWAPPVVEVEPEYCDNCHAVTADECYCSEPMGAFGDYFPCCSTPGGHVPIAAEGTEWMAPPRITPVPHRCPGCRGAGTGARCCICGGLR